MNKLLPLYLFFFFCTDLVSQRAIYAWPIDTPRVITGNYGELRPNHFHAGIDFSTGGNSGLPVYAVTDGYVSRIRVSSGAYGRAVYISHTTDNKLSLFAHLSAYAGALAEYVKREQLARQSYEFEAFPQKQELSFRKGDLIGYSGNSGNSTGPHLHFEIRDQQSEMPLNPLDFYMISDTVRPELQALGFYDLSDTLSPKFIRMIKMKRNKTGSSYPDNDSVTVNHFVIGFSFAGFDRFVSGGNPNVIYSAKLICDDQPVWSYRMADISFDDQRYVNEFAETINKLKFQKCFLPSLYPAMYPQSINKGRIMLTDTMFHQLRLELTDESGNSSAATIYIRTRNVSGFIAKKLPAGMLSCAREYRFSLSGIRLEIPAGTFYYSAAPWIDNKLEQNATFFIHPSVINLRNSFALSFKIPTKWIKYKQQLTLENNNSYYSPELKDDSVKFRVRSFGSFHLRVDSLAPTIKTQLTPKKIKRLRSFKTFNFVLRDNMSGISSYSLFVNGQWVIAEYDAKNNLLIYVPDDATPPGNLNFRVEAKDRVGNSTEFFYNLRR